MNRVSFDPAEVAAGLVFLAFGLFFGAQSLGLEMGTTLRMGPGYFPLVLSGLLIAFGLGGLWGGVKRGGEPIGPFALRGIIFILPAPVIFGLLVRSAGFVPAIFLCVLTASMATSRMKPLNAVALAAAVTVFSTLVFIWGLGLPFRPLGNWFDPPVAG